MLNINNKVVVCEHGGCCIEFPWHCRIRLFNGSFVIDLTSGLSNRGPELMLLFCRWTLYHLQLYSDVRTHARIVAKKNSFQSQHLGHGAEHFVSTRYQMADPGSLPAVSARKLFTRQRRMQVCTSTQELPSWKWESYRLLWLTEGKTGGKRRIHL